MIICNKKICLHNILLITVFLIILWGFLVRFFLKKDILLTKFCSFEGCDIWALSHFILYFILAYNFPSHFILLFSIGVFFEFFEYFVGTTDNFLTKLSPVSSDVNQVWWAGRISDVIFNTFGIIIGIYFSPYKK